MIDHNPAFGPNRFLLKGGGLLQRAYTRSVPPTMARQMNARARTIEDLLAQTLVADRLDEHLWAHIVTRVLEQPESVHDWLREDEMRLLGGLDATFCLAKTVLPGWRLRLRAGTGERPEACCDRPGYRLGFMAGADEPLAVCAALSNAILATLEKSPGRVVRLWREQLRRAVNPAGSLPCGGMASWFRSLAARPPGRPSAR